MPAARTSTSRRVAAALALATGLALLLPMAPAPALLMPTSRVNVSSAEAQANAAAVDPDVSGNGRFVVFSSRASNLTIGDTNKVADVFVRDRSAGTTRRVSLTNTGRQANGASFDASISADGRFVAFVSAATNLIAGDTNGVADIFVRDLYAGTTRRASVSLSGDQANGRSSAPSISDDGTVVAFVSAATNLVPGDTNGLPDVFVRDLPGTTTTRVSLGNSGQQGNGAAGAPAVNANGNLVYFTSAATNLVAGDTNGVTDVFARHLPETTTARVSVAGDGSQANGASADPAVDDNGYVVVFTSAASNLVVDDHNGVPDVFLRRSSLYLSQPAPITVVSQATNAAEAAGASGHPDISDDARDVLFLSNAANLVPDDTNGVRDAFVRDTFNNTTVRMSTASFGGQVYGPTGSAALSGNGRNVVFSSTATNVVAGDTNRVADVFLSFSNAPRLWATALKPWENTTPHDIAFLPDGRMLVTEAAGTSVRIAMYAGGGPDARLLSRTTVGTLLEEAGGYTRVLGLDTVRTGGTTYVYTCVPNVDEVGYRNQVVRYRATASRLLFDRYIIRRAIYTEGYGSGCAVRVGPDRKLWIATSDGGRSTLAQKPRALNGKVLRLNLDGSIPADNPIADVPSPGIDEVSAVYTLGHGAPVAIVFTPGTNRPYVVEQGPLKEDEINYLRAGRNYGYPCGVGTTEYRRTEDCDDYSTYTKPAWASGPDVTIRPSGAAIPVATAWRSWRNDLIVGNAQTTSLHRFVFNPTGTRAFQQTAMGRWRSAYGGFVVYGGARGLRIEPVSGGLFLAGVDGVWEDDMQDPVVGNLTMRVIPQN